MSEQTKLSVRSAGSRSYTSTRASEEQGEVLQRPRPAPRDPVALTVDLLVVVAAWVGDLMLSGAWTDDLHSNLSGDQVPLAGPAAVVGVMALLLLLHRRYPVPVLLIALAISTSLAIWLQFAQPIVCVLLALYAVARRGSWRRAGTVLALVVGYVGLVVSVIQRSLDSATTFGIVFPLVFFVVLTATVWGFARLENAAHTRARALTSQLEIRGEQAARKERARIARELHDILAHSVSAMMMQAAGARAMTSSLARDQPEDQRLRTVQDALGSIENTGSQSMRELHRLLGAMREEQPGNPLDIDDLRTSIRPGLEDLDALVETPRRSGLIVQVHRTGEAGTLDPSVGAAAYRMVQESLTNALKHAGRGGVVDVYEAWAGDQLKVQVRCRAGRDGIRPGTPNSGTGLRGLKERTELVGGTFESGWAGEEFLTTATLPTRPQPAKATDAPTRPRSATTTAAQSREAGSPRIARPGEDREWSR